MNLFNRYLHFSFFVRVFAFTVLYKFLSLISLAKSVEVF